MVTTLGKMTPVPVRNVWAHEARDFTTWLLANADALGESLGMQLELTTAEHRVGGFSLDLIGRDLATQTTVIIENQLEASDHSHLGQLLTYAGGTDPRTIVWCAATFREEHRAALDWLNEHTDEDTRFFGVEISAVRIDDSRPAPLFTLVAQPNNWTKQVHTQTSSALTGKYALYADFWSDLIRRVRQEHPDWTRATNPGGSHWVSMPYGTSAIWYSLVFSRSGPAIELYFGSSDAAANRTEYDRFAARSQELESLFGAELSWEPSDENKSCRIRCYRAEGGDVANAADRDALRDWFIDTMARFRAATQEIRSRLATTPEM